MLEGGSIVHDGDGKTLRAPHLTQAGAVHQRRARRLNMIGALRAAVTRDMHALPPSRKVTAHQMLPRELMGRGQRRKGLREPLLLEKALAHQPDGAACAGASVRHTSSLPLPQMISARRSLHRYLLPVSPRRVAPVPAPPVAPPAATRQQICAACCSAFRLHPRNDAPLLRAPAAHGCTFQSRQSDQRPPSVLAQAQARVRRAARALPAACSRRPVTRAKSLALPAKPAARRTHFALFEVNVSLAPLLVAYELIQLPARARKRSASFFFDAEGPTLARSLCIGASDGCSGSPRTCVARAGTSAGSPCQRR
jgi:hypothetical protein